MRPTKTCAKRHMQRSAEALLYSPTACFGAEDLQGPRPFKEVQQPRKEFHDPVPEILEPDCCSSFLEVQQGRFSANIRDQDVEPPAIPQPKTWKLRKPGLEEAVAGIRRQEGRLGFVEVRRGSVELKVA